MQADRIARLLPEVYQRTIVPGTPIATLVELMEQLHEPVEQVLAHYADYFDAQRTPDRFVPYLARWVDLARWLDDGSGEFDTGIGRLRQVVAAAPQLSRLRGTAQGLREALEWATGVVGVRIDTPRADAGARGRAFHIVVHLPAEARPYDSLVRRIVAQEKPAHVTADIVFAGADAGAPGVDAAPGPPVTRGPAPELPVGDAERRPEPAFPGAERGPAASPPAAGAGAGASG